MSLSCTAVGCLPDTIAIAAECESSLGQSHERLNTDLLSTSLKLKIHSGLFYPASHSTLSDDEHLSNFSVTLSSS